MYYLKCLNSISENLISHKVVLDAPISQELLSLRRRVAEMEEIQDQARAAVEKLSDAVEKLRAPALRLGTLLQKLPKSRALVCVGGTDYICNVDPALPEARTIAQEVGAAVATWRAMAKTFKLTAAQIERMSSAFEHADLAKASQGANSREKNRRTSAE